MLSGLPASGKSTMAQELLTRTGNSVRVNKDLLRTMLHFDKFTGTNESLTQDAEKALAVWALGAGKNVVVDDTNLSNRHLQSWKDLAMKNDASFIHFAVDTPWEVCVERDAQRLGGVGSFVIKNMALQYGHVKPMKRWVLCDIDGTIADCSHRLHHVQKPEAHQKNWKAFFSELGGDTLREDTLKTLRDFSAEGYDIIFVTARPETYRKETVAWLEKNGIGTDFYFTLIMRRENDKRPDTEVKQGILDTYFPDRTTIYKVIDDRPSVIRMWRSNGLDVIDVGKGEEF